MLLKKIPLYFFLNCIFCLDVHAWWTDPHRISATIAYLHLKENVRQDIDLLLPEFIEDSIWADTLSQKNSPNPFASWHFTTIPYDPESVLTPMDRQILAEQIAKKDIVWFISYAQKELQKNIPENLWLLRFLIHTVADIHQPLHCCSYYNSSEFREGDYGGNLFSIAEMNTKNLHLFWDSGLGLFADQKSLEEIHEFALSLIRRFPLESFGNLSTVLDSKTWSEESYDLATQFVYQLQPGSKPSVTYISQGQDVVCKQLTLAGYRLAHLLNVLWESK